MVSSRRCIVLMAVCLGVAAAGNDSTHSGAQEKRSADRQDDPLAVDANGDPLPAGAIARLGTSLGRPNGPLRFLADGKTLLVAGRFENMIYLRDAFTGKALRRFELQGQLEFFDFSPDGKTVVLVDRTQGVAAYLLRDIATDKEIGRLPGGKGVAPIGAVFSPDGSLLATSRDSLAVWDARSGKKLYELSLGAKCYNFAFSADSKTLSTGVPLKGFVVNQWEASTGKNLQTLTFTDDKLTNATFSSDGNLLALWGLKSPGFVADAKSGKEVFKTTTGGGRTFSPLGAILAVHGKESIRFLDARTGKERSHVDQGFVYSFVFSLDGKRIASTTSPLTIGLWDVATGRDLHPRQTGHRGQIADVALSADGKTLYASGTAFISIWSLDKRNLIGQLGDEKWVSPKREFLAQGRVLAQANSAGELQIWDRDGKDKGRLTDWGHVVGLDLSPDGKTVALLTVAKPDRFGGAIDLRLWDMAAKKELPRPPISPAKYSGLMPMPGSAVAFSPDGKLLASNDDKNVILWQVGTENKPRTIAARWKRSPFLLRFSPDGRFLAAACLNECFVWQVDAGVERRLGFVRGPEDKNELNIKSLCFSPDNRMLLTAHFTSIRLWDLESGDERWQLKSNAHGLAFTPDQKLLVSGGYDHAILLWDMQRLAMKSEPNVKLQLPDLQRLWSDLAGNARAAFVAQQHLASAPQQTIPFLAERLRRKPVDQQRLTDLIARFDGKAVLGAETASNELAQLGTLAEDRLREALRGKPVDEIRVHLERTLRKIEDSPNRLRELRAIETLERVGTPETLRLLSDFAKSLPSLRLRQEAQESAARLMKVARAE